MYSKLMLVVMAPAHPPPHLEQPPPPLPLAKACPSPSPLFELALLHCGGSQLTLWSQHRTNIIIAAVVQYYILCTKHVGFIIIRSKDGVVLFTFTVYDQQELDIHFQWCFVVAGWQPPVQTDQCLANLSRFLSCILQQLAIQLLCIQNCMVCCMIQVLDQ